MVVRENITILGDDDTTADAVLIRGAKLARRIRPVLALAEEAAQIGHAATGQRGRDCFGGDRNFDYARRDLFHHGREAGGELALAGDGRVVDIKAHGGSLRIVLGVYPRRERQRADH